MLLGRQCVNADIASCCDTLSHSLRRRTDLLQRSPCFVKAIYTVYRYQTMVCSTKSSSRRPHSLPDLVADLGVAVRGKRKIWRVRLAKPVCCGDIATSLCASMQLTCSTDLLMLFGEGCEAEAS